MLKLDIEKLASALVHQKFAPKITPKILAAFWAAPAGVGPGPRWGSGSKDQDQGPYSSSLSQNPW